MAASALALQLVFTSPDTLPPLDANNCTVLTSLCMGGADSPLAALRNASLSCLRRFADVTPDFGTRDSDKWEEYAPTCATWNSGHSQRALSPLPWILQQACRTCGVFAGVFLHPQIHCRVGADWELMARAE